MLLALAVSAAGAALGQTRETPIDNDQVTVIKVTEQPHAKTALHEHKFNRVMLYLQPGRQEIVPQNGKKNVLIFKAGEVKWSPTSGLHTSEVVSEAPVTIIELEIKKQGNGKAIATKLDPVKVDPQDYKVEFENSQVRVVRVRMPAHRQTPMHEHLLNRVVIYLTDQNTLVTTPDGKTETVTHKAGEASWGGATTHKELNQLDGPFEVVVVEFKS